MRNIILVMMMIFGFCGCSKHNYSLSDLQHNKISFNNLPKEIIAYLKDSDQHQLDIQNMLVVLPKKNTTNFSLETVNTLIGPWVSYEKLVDKEKNIFYKIQQGVPSPYIVFENKLYIPDRFNILTTVNDIEKLEFTCYILK